MTSVFIEPCDIVFFRDDLPFGAVGTQVGRCQFPPRPSVVAGALRTKVLASQGVDLDAFREGRDLPEAVRREIGAGQVAGNGPALAPGTFGLVGLHLGRRRPDGDVACYRAGRDLVVPGKGSAVGGPAAPRLLSPAGTPVPGTSSLEGLAPLGIAPGFEPAVGWLEAGDYLRYLRGELPEGTVIQTDDVLDWDYRVGISLDVGARTVDEGRLYSSRGAVLRGEPDLARGFVAEVDGCSLLPVSGLIRLGGDGRMARLSPWAGSLLDWSPVRASVAATGRFRLVLQTPAIFAKGWYPGILRDADGAHFLERDRFRARLVSAAVGAPEMAGGWNLVRRGPKPFRLTAPSGSVYWFEVESGSAEAAWEELHGTSISDERREEGYGLVHMGGWAHV